MEELEKNQADTEKNIADLLEDDEDLMEPTLPPAPQIIESQPPSSNLSQLLKGESSKRHLSTTRVTMISCSGPFHSRRRTRSRRSKKDKCSVWKNSIGQRRNRE